MNVLFIRHGESENNTLHDRLRLAFPGEPASADALFRQQRHFDPPLTATGASQVVAVANRVREECSQSTGGVQEIWVSYLKRALDTAAALSDALPLAKVVVMDDIHEVGGSYRFDEASKSFVGVPGTTKNQVQSAYATFSLFDAAAAPPSSSQHPETGDEGWYKLPAKEPHGVAAERAMRLLSRLEQRCRNEAAGPGPLPTIAVVTHGDFFKLIMKALHERLLRGFERESGAGQSASIPQWFDAEGNRPSDSWIQNTSVTRFRLHPDPPASTHQSLDSARDNAEVVWHVEYFADASHL